MTVPAMAPPDIDLLLGLWSFDSDADAADEVVEEGSATLVAVGVDVLALWKRDWMLGSLKPLRGVFNVAPPVSL
jgi:hypothetical protein